MLYTVHGVDEIPTKVLHTFGAEQPESPGLCGGYPSTTNQFQILRNSEVENRFAAGELPGRLEDLEGTLEAFGAYAITSQQRGDVYRAVAMGGGGYGDPIDRDPEHVRRDVDAMLVTEEWAERLYGVVVRDGAVLADATRVRRDAIRSERLRAAGVDTAVIRRPDDWDPTSEGVRLLEALFYDVRSGLAIHRCRCGHILGPAERSYKELAALARYPVQHVGPEVDPYDVGGGRFEVRESYCPNCATLLNVEIARPFDELIDDARLSETWLRRMTRNRAKAEA
jgi:N-methylhydantoinase B